MTIQLNSKISRGCFSQYIKKEDYLIDNDCSNFAEHTTYYQDELDDYVFPKLFYKMKENKLYTLFNGRQAGSFELMDDLGLI